MDKKSRLSYHKFSRQKVHQLDVKSKTVSSWIQAQDYLTFAANNIGFARAFVILAHSSDFINKRKVIYFTLSYLAVCVGIALWWRDGFLFGVASTCLGTSSLSGCLSCLQQIRGNLQFEYCVFHYFGLWYLQEFGISFVAIPDVLQCNVIW